MGIQGKPTKPNKVFEKYKYKSTIKDLIIIIINLLYSEEFYYETNNIHEFIYKYEHSISIVIIMNFGLSGISLPVLNCDLCSPVFSVIRGNVVPFTQKY